jgi:glycosyltransferase involved in cell wall biosynthesis
MLPTVSVITPTRSRTEKLLRAARSVVRQDYPGLIEHVIVGDNHPTLEEFSSEIIQINPDASVFNLHNEHEYRTTDGLIAIYTPSRASYARNYGILHATGQYIAQLDDDNEFEPEHISSLVAVLEADPKIGVAYSGRKLVLPDESPYLEERYPWETDNEEIARYLYRDFVRKGIFVRGSNIVWDMVVAPDGEAVLTVDTSEILVRREIHNRFLFSTRYSTRSMMQHHTEDYDLVRRIYEAGVCIKSSGKATLRYYLGGYSNV